MRINFSQIKAKTTKEKFEDTKGLSRSLKSDNTMVKRKTTKRQTMIYKTLHRKLTIERHEPRKKTGVNSGASKGLPVPVPPVASVVSLVKRQENHPI